METTYRFRFLIYLAAFMLLMSVCFVYAEPLPENHLLFQVAPRHAAFLAPFAESPIFDRDALRATSPVVSSQVVGQLETPSHPHRGLFHRTRHTAIRPLLSNAPIQFVVVDGAIESPAPTHNRR
jgi:hypothetical protein